MSFLFKHLYSVWSLRCNKLTIGSKLGGGDILGLFGSVEAKSFVKTLISYDFGFLGFDIF